MCLEDGGDRVLLDASMYSHQTPPCKRGMGPDAGVVHRCVQQNPTPGACIPGNPDGGTCPNAGQHIIIDVTHLPVDKNILGEEEISEAALLLQLQHAGGPSGTRLEHLRMWLHVAT